MKISIIKISAILLLVLFSGISATGQDKLEILFSKEVRHETIDSQEVGTYWGDVQIKKGDIFMYMDSIRQINRKLWAYDNILIQQGDSLSLFGDSMFYDDIKTKLFLYGDVVIKKGEESLFTNFLEYDLNTKIGFYKNEGLLTNMRTFLSSKYGTYYAATDDVLFKDSVYVEDPDFTLKADSLWFNQLTRIITFNGPTIIKFEESNIYCEAGYYDIENSVAVFIKNVQYSGTNNIAVADSIIYNQKIGEVQLRGNAFYRTDSLQARAHNMIYHEAEQYVKLIKEGDFKSSDMSAKGDYLEYYIRSRNFKTNQRATIINGGSIISADNYDMNNAVGEGTISGNVVFHDTINKTILWADSTLINNNTEYIKSYGDRPILMNYSDGDTLWIAADTLLSFKAVAEEWQRQNKTQRVIENDLLFGTDPDTISDLFLSDASDSLAHDITPIVPDSISSFQSDTSLIADTISNKVEIDTILLNISLPDNLIQTDPIQIDSLPTDTTDNKSRIIQAIGSVKIYNAGLQGICDSLTYIGQDSIFYLDNSPVLWSDSTQITGDSIRMMMSGNKPSRFHAIDKVFMINTADGYFFSQIAGKKAEGHMNEGRLKELWVRGTVKTIFYIINDDDEYVGVNKHDASRLKAEFEEGKLENIIYFDKPEGEMLPMRGTNHEGLKLEGFKFMIEKRPVSPEDLRPQLPLSLVEVINTLRPDSNSDEDEELSIPEHPDEHPNNPLPSNDNVEISD